MVLSEQSTTFAICRYEPSSALPYTQKSPLNSTPQEPRTKVPLSISKEKLGFTLPLISARTGTVPWWLVFRTKTEEFVEFGHSYAGHGQPVGHPSLQGQSYTCLLYCWWENLFDLVISTELNLRKFLTFLYSRLQADVQGSFAGPQLKTHSARLLLA